MIETLIILGVSVIFFATGKIRSDLVALCALLLLLVLGILTPDEALSGFSNSVVIMMVGLFVVGGAISQTGLAKMISGKIMNLAGTNETRLFLLVMVVTSVVGAFISNTGTVALMLPIIVSLSAKAKSNVRRFLIPLAYASSMGGMLTLIGTSPNLVIQEALTNNGFKPLGFFSFTPVGIVCILVGVIVLLPLTAWFLKRKDDGGDDKKHDGKSLDQLVSEYHLEDNLQRYVVGHKSEIKGKTVAELDIHNRYGLTILEVRSETRRQKGIIKNVSQKLAGPKTILKENDIIYVSGEKEQAERFAADYALKPYVSSNKKAEDGSSLDFYDIGIAEIVLLPTSQLVNRALKESGFRSKYGINVVGVRRKGEYIMEDLVELRFRSGDVLLVQGTWANILRLNSEENNWVVLGQPLEQAAKVTLDYKAPVAAFIMVLMVVLIVFDFIPIEPVTAVMIAGVLMVLCGCFRNVEAAYKTINWESVVLVAAMMPMSVALEKTGVSAHISHSLVNGIGALGPYVLLAGIYYTTSLCTMFISNTATAVLMAPIALSSATELGLSPYAFLFAVTLGASMCFASPFSTPPNAIVMQAGRYTFMDYIKVGLPLQIIMGIVMVFVLPLLFHF
ncbi:MAG: SLC13 family permease [Prevotella sp.]|nr:SLC13 family permease [Prevotella sp.]